MGEEWLSNNLCYVDAEVSVTGTLVIRDERLHNEGTINIYGTIGIYGSDAIKNYGTINIYDSGTINVYDSGTIHNHYYGTIKNDHYIYISGYGTINNYGRIQISDFLITNDGIIGNYGTIEITLHSGRIANFGTIYNNGPIANAGIIDNYNDIYNLCIGVIAGDPVTNHDAGVIYILDKCVYVPLSFRS